MESAPEGTVVFVRNIPFHYSSASLSEMCGGFGPVARSVVVTRPGAPDRSLGFGFVQFAVPEDAAACVSGLAGKDVEGRPITVEIASA